MQNCWIIISLANNVRASCTADVNTKFAVWTWNSAHQYLKFFGDYTALQKNCHFNDRFHQTKWLGCNPFSMASGFQSNKGDQLVVVPRYFEANAVFIWRIIRTFNSPSNTFIYATNGPVSLHSLHRPSFQIWRVQCSMKGFLYLNRYPRFHMGCFCICI